MSTQTPTPPSTAPETLPATKASTEAETYTSTQEDVVQPRKRGKQAFEHTHTRVTYWLNKQLKKRFEKLAKTQETSFSRLLDEAVEDLLKKYGE